MKEIYLEYSPYTKIYHYYEGKRRQNHHEYHEINEVYDFLKSNVKNKANVCLRLGNLEKKFSDEVKVEVHKRLPKIKIEKLE